jgi:hypothetical protein
MMDREINFGAVRMFGERRRHPRTPINRVARIQTNSGQTSECTITDISDYGAKLFVNDADLPPCFDLVIYGVDVNRHECRMAWRNGGEVGVEFVAPGHARQETFDQIREEARSVFAAGADRA